MQIILSQFDRIFARFASTGRGYATVPRPPTAVGGDGISHKRSWPMSRAERAAADNCAVRAARWPKGDVRANARISPASPASDFGQRSPIYDFVFFVQSWGGEFVQLAIYEVDLPFPVALIIFIVFNFCNCNWAVRRGQDKIFSTSFTAILPT